MTYNSSNPLYHPFSFLLLCQFEHNPLDNTFIIIFKDRCFNYPIVDLKKLSTFVIVNWPTFCLISILYRCVDYNSSMKSTTNELISIQLCEKEKVNNFFLVHQYLEVERFKHLSSWLKVHVNYDWAIIALTKIKRFYDGNRAMKSCIRVPCDYQLNI